MENDDIIKKIKAGWILINRGSERDPFYFIISPNRAEWINITKDNYHAGMKATEAEAPMK